MQTTKASIFKLWSENSDKFYIGYNKQTDPNKILNVYRSYSRNDNKNVSKIKEILELGNYHIDILEICDYDEEQLRLKRTKYLMEHRENCLNKVPNEKTYEKYYERYCKEKKLRELREYKKTGVRYIWGRVKLIL